MPQSAPTGGLPAVDHLIWVVPDLAWGMDEIERRLGERPAVGGRHPALGSHNALLALGSDTYLEIMAADPGLPRPARGRLFGLDGLQEPRLATWVLRCEAIEAVAAQAADRGLDLGAIHAGSRERPDGTVVAWKITDPYAARLQGVVPFLIAWGDTPHPARSAPAAGRLRELRIEHPEPAAVRGALACLGLELAVRPGQQPRLVATIDGPAGEFRLGR
jgi:hypothetical protein